MGKRPARSDKSVAEYIPAPFKRKILEMYGATGAEWLERLPRLIADCEQRWSLRVMQPFSLSYNYVAPAERAGGTPVVLKLGVPNPELSNEIAALRIYAGRGVVQLLDADPERGILLLARIFPGTPLSQVEDDRQATSIAAGVIRRIWQPAPEDHSFPTVSEWAQGLQTLRARFDGETGPLPSSLVEKAESLFAELLASTSDSLLLHGDLHHENILSAPHQSWLALDPQGVIGELTYETSAYLCNPIPDILKESNLNSVLRRRVDQLADELDLNRSRILGWGFAHAVLSAWWDFEDFGHDWEPWIAIAEAFTEIR